MIMSMVEGIALRSHMAILQEDDNRGKSYGRQIDAYPRKTINMDAVAALRQEKAWKVVRGKPQNRQDK